MMFISALPSSCKINCFKVGITQSIPSLLGVLRVVEKCARACVCVCLWCVCVCLRCVCVCVCVSVQGLFCILGTKLVIHDGGDLYLQLNC